MPTPNFAAYGASKPFVLSFSEGIAEDVRGSGVTVTCVCPCMTRNKKGIYPIQICFYPLQTCELKMALVTLKSAFLYS